MDELGKMPTRVARDLALAIAAGRSFEIIVQAVDAERIPIGERSRPTSPVPRTRIIMISILRPAANPERWRVPTRMFGLTTPKEPALC